VADSLILVFQQPSKNPPGRGFLEEVLYVEHAGRGADTFPPGRRLQQFDRELV
jgi:hypothetical protein